MCPNRHCYWEVPRIVREGTKPWVLLGQIALQWNPTPSVVCSPSVVSIKGPWITLRTSQRTGGKSRKAGNSLTMVFLKESIRGCFLLHHLILARTELLSEEEHMFWFLKSEEEYSKRMIQFIGRACTDKRGCSLKATDFSRTAFLDY